MDNINYSKRFFVVVLTLFVMCVYISVIVPESIGGRGIAYALDKVEDKALNKAEEVKSKAEEVKNTKTNVVSRIASVPSKAGDRADKSTSQTANKAGQQQTSNKPGSPVLLDAVAGIFKNKSEALSVQKYDSLLGCPSAKHIIIEYSSMSCPYCVEFHQKVFPQIKKNLIDTCKVRYAFRDFPNSRAALDAAVLAHCLARTPLVSLNNTNAASITKYYELVEKFMGTYKSWAMTGDYKSVLKDIAVLSGADKADVEKCMGVDSMEMGRMVHMRAAESNSILEIKYSPSIIIDGKILVGYKSYDEILAALEMTGGAIVGDNTDTRGVVTTDKKTNDAMTMSNSGANNNGVNNANNSGTSSAIGGSGTSSSKNVNNATKDVNSKK